MCDRKKGKLILLHMITVGSKPCTVHLHMLLWLVPSVITLVNVRVMFKFH